MKSMGGLSRNYDDHDILESEESHTAWLIEMLTSISALLTLNPNMSCHRNRGLI